MGIRLGMVGGDKVQHAADVSVLWLEPQAGDRSTIRFAFLPAENSLGIKRRNPTIYEVRVVPTRRGQQNK